MSKRYKACPGNIRRGYDLSQIPYGNAADAINWFRHSKDVTYLFIHGSAEAGWFADMYVKGASGEDRDIYTLAALPAELGRIREEILRENYGDDP